MTASSKMPHQIISLSPSEFFSTFILNANAEMSWVYRNVDLLNAHTSLEAGSYFTTPPAHTTLSSFALHTPGRGSEREAIRSGCVYLMWPKCNLIWFRSQPRPSLRSHASGAGVWSLVCPHKERRIFFFYSCGSLLSSFHSLMSVLFILKEREREMAS